MTISVGCNQGATFTLHAWDNAQALGEKYSLDFDSGDDLLAGFRQEFGSTLPTGPLVREAARICVLPSE
jgi:hypothetical protein